MNNGGTAVRQKKEKQNKISSGKLIAFGVLILLLVMAIAAVASDFTGISVAEIGKNGDSGSLIYDSLPDSIKDIEAYSTGSVLLTDTSLDYIDSSGRMLASNAHLYSQPVMKINKSNVLLYDRGSNSFRIESNSSIYNVFTVDGSISAAAIGAKNNYAYVLNGEGGYQSHLYVYTFRGQKQFEWGSASDYCVAMKLSDNGKSIAISTIGVDSAEYYSRVLLFNFRQDEPVFSVELPDCTVFELDFINKSGVAAFTDNGLYSIKNDGTVTKVCDYVPSEICHSSSSANLKTVVLANHGNTKDNDVVVFNKKYEELFRIKADTEVYAVRSTDKFIAVICGDEIKIYDTDNTCIGNITIGEKCLDAAFSGRTVYVRTVSGIYSFDSYDNIDLTAVKEDASSDTETTKESKSDSDETDTTQEAVSDISEVTTEQQMNFG